ncbi:hypothetical protein PIB30_058789 [Stylosanthes scabra]|uniref:Uncharacterized protein n=1 Tax=Stylosanthes scabra TaxID=79078 RepID=A0ABU6WID4_9FABA|nr:hypothetical protein [Stylosanthes scabra]
MLVTLAKYQRFDGSNIKEIGGKTTWADVVRTRREEEQMRGSGLESRDEVKGKGNEKVESGSNSKLGEGKKVIEVEESEPLKKVLGRSIVAESVEKIKFRWVIEQIKEKCQGLGRVERGWCPVSLAVGDDSTYEECLEERVAEDYGGEMKVPETPMEAHSLEEVEENPTMPFEGDKIEWWDPLINDELFENKDGAANYVSWGGDFEFSEEILMISVNRGIEHRDKGGKVYGSLEDSETYDGRENSEGVAHV